MAPPPQRKLNIIGRKQEASLSKFTPLSAVALWVPSAPCPWTFFLDSAKNTPLLEPLVFGPDQVCGCGDLIVGFNSWSSATVCWYKACCIVRAPPHGPRSKGSSMGSWLLLHNTHCRYDAGERHNMRSFDECIATSSSSREVNRTSREVNRTSREVNLSVGEFWLPLMTHEEPLWLAPSNM